MRATLNTGPRRRELVDSPEPRPAPDRIVAEIAGVVCGTGAGPGPGSGFGSGGAP